MLASLLQDDGIVTSGGRVSLAGFSGKIFGLSEASGGRFLVSSPAPEYGGSGTIEAFDATTGAALGTVATFHGFLGAAGFWGLACAQ